MAISYENTLYGSIPAGLAVQPVGGLNGRDQRSSAWQQSIKYGTRLSDKRPLNRHRRVKTSVALTAGRGHVVGVSPVSDTRGRNREISPVIYGRDTVRPIDDSLASIVADLKRDGIL